MSGRRTIMNEKLQSMLKKTVATYVNFNDSLPAVPGKTEKATKNMLCYPVTGPIFEPRPFRTQRVDCTFSFPSMASSLAEIWKHLVHELSKVRTNSGCSGLLCRAILCLRNTFSRNTLTSEDMQHVLWKLSYTSREAFCTKRREDLTLISNRLENITSYNKISNYH